MYYYKQLPIKILLNIFIIQTYNPTLQSRMDLGLPNDPPPDCPIKCLGLPRANTQPSQILFHVVLQLSLIHI